MKNKLCCLLGAAFFLYGCSSTRKVTLDPISVSANAAGANIYRGSYAKTTDILHTKLDISFNWDSAFVIGRAQITAKPYFYPSDSISLDARGFKINKVVLLRNEEELPLNYSYNGRLLNIKLDKTYQNTQKFNVQIDYVAMPYKLRVGKDIESEDMRGLYFINRDGKDNTMPREIWTQGETECNSAWFPTIDGPQEKMTQEISVTVPNNMISLSNGSLDFSTDNGDGTRTDSWRQEQPHSTYLTMVAAGDFNVVKDHWRDKEVNYYMEPGYSQNAKLIFGKTPEMMEFFSRKLGVDFPWDKYSQIVVRQFSSGAMENTSATVLYEGMNMTEGKYLDENHEDIISHELFHHWFGDLVTCESWANLPLNESFATYGEYLWNEHKYGRDYADMRQMQDTRLYFSNPGNKDRDLIRYNYADREQMFDEVTYQKGGAIVHMLRKVVGDEAFFKALNLYLTRYAYKTVEVHDLRRTFEEVTGQDLNWFFNEWFLGSGHPILKIETSYDAANKLAVVNLQQQQAASGKSTTYKIPMAVDIYVNGKTERRNIVFDKQVQSFSFPVDSEPQLINVDAEKVVLAEKQESKPVTQYVFQYKNAPLFMDRYEAILKLKGFEKEKEARETVIAALADKNWYIRQAALDFVPKLSPAEKTMIYEKIRSMALQDERSLVRADALSVLKKEYSDRDNGQVFEKAASDKSVAVQKVIGK